MGLCWNRLEIMVKTDCTILVKSWPRSPKLASLLLHREWKEVIPHAHSRSAAWHKSQLWRPGEVLCHVNWKMQIYAHMWTEAGREYTKAGTVVSGQWGFFLNAFIILLGFLHINYWYIAILFYIKSNHMKLPIFIAQNGIIMSVS